MFIFSACSLDTKQYYQDLSISFLLEPLKYEFEKWRAIRASVGGVGGVLAWVAC